jgi:hypothetical protein
VCNSFFRASYSKTLYEAIFTIEDPDPLWGRLGPNATDGKGPALPKLLQDGGGFHGDDKGRPVKTDKIEMREPRADKDSTFPRIGMSVPRIVSVAPIMGKPATICPNPVSRGATMQLAWKTQPGQYQITLMGMRGQLIAERMLDVGGAGQVDSWEIPASLAAGIYVLRVMRAGMAGSGAAGPAAVCTREVMVR